MRSAQPRMRLEPGLNDHERAESQGDHGQQLAVGLRERFVDHKLHLQGHDECRDLQRHRQDQHLRDRPAPAMHLGPEQGELHRQARFERFEGFASRQLQDHAGEMLRRFCHRKDAKPDRRIVDGDALGRDRLQHDEVIEVPVRDGGKLDLGERRQFDADGARGKSELVRDSHQAFQRSAGHRHRKPLTQRIEVDIVAVIARDHGEAGQAAFRGFRRHHDGERSSAQIEFSENVHARRPTA